ncbi:hypothetical protein CC85DRAFT_288768 [Cutaneotrichosporon oleaginosum]|uniref:Uncharacterized protein n=1 Tax=Cutaneotrichosporon oleaginosum TaxID=879819 RepID=A0A0J0XDM9_9TREE|nr:uncharacterized protein CC85DRAFT_288768 [Cutaneotrichosporon oleaginosum]KLT39210.1 hypothetical protein CC85DRAFT_288768 [Cutaneotrichosporon oleaginosum]TXT05703.1 hypothetical protein COLE_07023 [Cutaneotrichosporon oleaginosum]
MLVVGVLLFGLAAAQVPPITPTLFFNLTINPQDGFPSFSTGEWDLMNMTTGWAARALINGRMGQAQMWMNGPFCTAVSMQGEYSTPELQWNESTPVPVRLVLDTTATVNAQSGGGDVRLAAEGDWHYCAPRVDVDGVDFWLYNMTITTGMVAAASDILLVPGRSQSILDDHNSINDFFHVTSPDAYVNWVRQAGASVRFDTTLHPVVVVFDMPYSTGFFRLYGSVGPDHSDLEIRVDPPLPGVPAGGLVAVNPNRTREANERLLFAAPVDPHTRYTVTIPLRRGQEQALTKVDFLSGLGVGNYWPEEPAVTDGLTPQTSIGGRGLSGGAIAGIVIGALAAVTLLLAAAFIYRARRKTRRDTQRWSDVKLRRMSLSPQVSPPRDVKTPLPPSPISPVSPPQRAHHYPPSAEDLHAEPRTPWPWTERPGQARV